MREQGAEAPGEIAAAIRYANRYRLADLLIVGGTSLAVYPAAGLIRYFRGDDLVVINKQPTPADGMATLLVNKPIGQALSETEGEGEAICR